MKNNLTELVPLSTVADVIMGQSPKGDTYNKASIGTPLLNGPTEFTDKHPQKLQWTTSPTKLCQNNDVLLCVRGSSTGRINISNDEYCIGRGLAAIRNKSNFSQDFLIQCMQFHIDSIIRLASGTTFPNLDRKTIASLLVPNLPIQEQQKIAEILSTVDKKIDLIDQKIAETEKLKTGLMQKLFSEGVGVQDENGEWQPHTEFQDSPFGKIPQPWSTLELAEIADIEDGDRGKSYPKQADFSDFGYCLFLSAKNVTKQGFTYETTQFISQEKHNKLRKGQVLQNDIVLTTRGTVGNFGLFKHEELFDAVRINSGMAIIRCIDSSMPNYLYQFMQSPQFKAQISKVVFGSAQPQLTIKQIKKFKVLVPISEEKKWIEETLKLVNDKLTLLEQQKAETQQLKKGLMQKLLTGEWRVPVEETEAA
ncbi:TPA: restriction endonuclease subunit S [Vibrio parahaemolyticus]|nr:restriction endonuclease subunit S [Vibrio fluvialis]ELV8729169.1 restriction endonuclease subunit S [Vibrio fluvialis]ELX9690166.1 restriction endonuclease subunit S [Vibrio fluvialis]HCE2278570.1 restriction endonuclease subunit S [Vibrio parahaemolyticus]